MHLATKLAEFATTIGLDSLTITSAAPFSAEEQILRARLEANLYPPFTTSNLTQRCYPTAMLSDCQAVIVAALSYHTQDQAKAPPPGFGYIARYAQRDDYHQVLSAKLQALAEFLTQHTSDEHRFKIQVDNGPCIERAAALRSGAGWQGKNNLLYIPRLGSWVVLGLLFTNVSLKHQHLAPQSQCGSCERCIKSCPTSALTAPYTLDSQRCLAYITQMPGLIPHPYRKLMGQRIWGCDTCQAVCPHNAKAVTCVHPEWGEQVTPPHLLSLLDSSQADFDAQFARTALYWRGRTTLQRNAAIALGNLGDQTAITALATNLRQHPSPILRATCAWALGEIGGDSVQTILIEAQLEETEPLVQAEIDMAMAASHFQR